MSYSNYNSNDKSRGDSGEKAWAAYLQSYGYQTHMPTTEQNLKGVDICATKDGEFRLFDVKVDGMAQKTGNVGIELFTTYANGRNHDGWGQSTQADWWVWLCEDKLNPDVYNYVMLKPSEVVPMLPQLREQFPRRATRRDGGGKETWSLYFNIEALRDTFTNVLTGWVPR